MIFKSRHGKSRIGTETNGAENRTNITTSNLNGAEYLSKIISGTIMQGGRLLTGNSKDRGPVNNVAQDTYLMPFRLGQGRAFKDAGYDRDYQSEKKRDYGLVQKAVGNENIPIYSRVNNPEKRKELIQIYNPESTYNPNIKYPLIHAAFHPSSLYIDGTNGNIMYKGWDLNDYGTDRGGRGFSSQYGSIRKALANTLDVFGNPTVVTTGYQNVLDNDGKPMNIFKGNYKDDFNANIAVSDFIVKQLLKKENPSFVNEYGMSPIPEVVITAPRKKHRLGGSLTYKKRNHLSDGICKAKYGTTVPYKRIHINEDGTFTDILTGKVYNTSATNGEDVIITGKANHWKEAGKRNINSYSPYSSIREIAKDYLYKKLDNWVDKNVLEPNNYDINKIRRTLYNKLDPFGYNKKDSLGNVVISPDKKIKTALNSKTPNRNFLKNDDVIMRNPIYAKYLGLKDYYNGYSMVNTDDNLKISNYSPTIGNQGNIYYKSPTESDSSWGPFSDKVLARAFKTRDNKGKNTFVSPHYDGVMGHYTTSFGKDKKGKYISYYDIWDLNPFEGTPIENGDIGERYGIGKPVHLYNRKYYTDADSTRIMNKYNRLRHLRRRDNFNINDTRY